MLWNVIFSTHKVHVLSIIELKTALDFVDILCIKLIDTTGACTIQLFTAVINGFS